MAKPWIDLNRYREIRIKETITEVELAEKFMELGS